MKKELMNNYEDFFDEYNTETDINEEFQIEQGNTNFDIEPELDTEILISCCIKICLLVITLLITKMSVDRSFLNSSFSNENYIITDSNAADDAFRESKESKDIQYVVNTENENLIKNETYNNFVKAKNNNTNVIGWIKISGTLIDYPIMHSKDDSYYLTHNSSEKEDKNGAIFMESSQNGWSSINMIHGHNLKSGKMFGQLVKYKEEDFCKEHRYIEIARDDKVLKYKVFSVFIADGSNEEFPIQFTDYVKYKEYYVQLLERSMFKLDTSVNVNDIILLNTCSYEFSNAHFIVCAQLVED